MLIFVVSAINDSMQTQLCSFNRFIPVNVGDKLQCGNTSSL